VLCKAWLPRRYQARSGRLADVCIAPPANGEAVLASNVLHVIASAGLGGAEAVVQTLAHEAVRRGQPVGVAALVQVGEPPPLVDELRSAGVAVWTVRAGRRRYSREARLLGDVAREAGATVLHTHGYHADIVGYRVARRLGLPVVSTAHGFTAGDWKNRLYEWLDEGCLRRFDAVIAVSEPLRRRLLEAGCAPERVRLVPNGVAVQGDLASRDSARQALGLPATGPVIGWVGRLAHEKGPDLLLAVTGELRARGATVAIVGEGPLRPALEDAVRAAGAEPLVRLLGVRPGVGRWLRAFDVLVISSRSEGLPMVLLEAMAAGVPVASFAVGAVPDVLQDGETGWLASSGDVTGLRAAVAAALADPAEGRRRADQARRVVEQQYGAAAWLDAVMHVYDEVAGPRGCSAAGSAGVRKA